MGKAVEIAPEAEGFEAARARQEAGAAERVLIRNDERARKIAAIETKGGLVDADEPERIVMRIDRLSRYYPGVRPVNPSAVLAGDPGAKEAAGAVLERVINTPDFVDVRYLEAGQIAARAVGRVDIHDARRRLVGYGTGSLVSPRLLLTNHHVLPDAATAAVSSIEFNYQDGIDGKPLQPVQLPLDPATFFLTDEQLDFALVAVGASAATLAAFGFNRLIGDEGKAIPGDFVTVVQHPGGEKKQVALRENRVVDVFSVYLHYQTDTEPGSSGSPVFNDQWEVVALHHAGVPAPEHKELGGWVNEGIRISRILEYVGKQRFQGAQQALAAQLRASESISVPATAAPSPNGSEPAAQLAPQAAAAPSPVAAAAHGLTWSLPLELAVELRGATVSGAGLTVPVATTASTPGDLERLVEPFHDEDLTGRRGYESDFLGVQVPAPSVLDESVVSRLDDGSHVLPYEHFSIVMNKLRRLALFTASNVDASPPKKRPEPGQDYSRRGLSGLGPHDQEKWFSDPRIPADHQLPDRFFTRDRSSFDKGHIVRREDVAWGDTHDELRRANGDTFHVTNCSPQVADFNRSNLQGLWGELENIVLKQAATERYCLFAGPVLRDDDRVFRGVDDTGAVEIKIPRQFWKIVVAHTGGALQAFAFVLDQNLDHTDLEFAVDAEWRTRMIAVPHLEQILGAVKFPRQLHHSDQFGAGPGEALRASAGIDAVTPPAVSN